MRRKPLKAKWTKEEFDQEKNRLQGGSAGIAVLFTFSYVIFLFCIEAKSLSPSSIFVLALIYAIAQRKRFYNWKQELIESKQLSLQEFLWLSKKYGSEEYNYFSTKGIVFWCIFGLVIFGWCAYLGIEKLELRNHSAFATGKVVRVIGGKNPEAAVEFYVDGKGYEAHQRIYRNNWGDYSYLSNADTPLVNLNDRIKVKYYIEDPDNNEAVALPIH